MNIQNITALTQMLTATGFDASIGYQLLQHICFKLPGFVLTERVTRGKDLLTCSIHFERKGEEYICNYYDASFLKYMDVPDLVIQGIGLRELDQRMQQIEWEAADSNHFDHQDAFSWQREKEIEKVVTDINRLLVNPEGKYFADSLKIKYWSGLHESVTGSLNALRSRFEVSQRFYFYDDQGISVDEAYRFLLNRWLEKRLQAKRKAENDLPPAEPSEGNNGSAAKGLLQKKPKGKRSAIKH